VGSGLSHRQRRVAILREHSEVRQLFGPCLQTALLGTVAVAAQLGFAATLSGAPWWLLLAAAYAVGAFLSYELNVIVHECSHNLVFRGSALNKAFGILLNVPGVLPSAIAFRHYHLLHHRFLGQPGVDADVPSRWAVALVGHGKLGKLTWLLTQPFTYGLINPTAVRPRIPVDGWLVANCVAAIGASVGVAYWLGPGALAYLALSAYLAVGPHPTGAHILQEHIIFEGREETSSYYGPMNAFSINHGLHVEHHDFPTVAGPRLARLRAMASSYYRDRFHHRSRFATLWRFVMDPRIGLDSRAIRAPSADLV